MMRHRSGMAGFFLRVLFVVLVTAGPIVHVWLGSSVTSIQYELRSLEEQKAAAIKDMKMLLAERAKLMSLSNIEGSLQNRRMVAQTRETGSYVFPDRVKVIHIKKKRGPEPYRASFAMSGDERR